MFWWKCVHVSDASLPVCRERWPLHGLEMGVCAAAPSTGAGCVRGRHGAWSWDCGTRESPPRSVLQAQQSKSRFSFLVLTCWGCKDNNKIKCHGSTHGPQSMVELQLCHCDLEGIQQSNSVEWWVHYMWSLSPSTLPSLCDSRQRLDVNVWCGYVSGKLIWISENFHKSWNVILLISVPPPS